MTMQPEDTSQAAGAIPTQESQVPVQSAQSENAYTESELRRIVREEVSDSYRTLQGQITPLQMLRPQLEEVIGSTKKVEMMVQRIFAGQATDEDRKAFEDAVKLTEAQERATKAESEAKAWKVAVKTPEEEAALTFNNDYIPRAQRFAERNGLKWPEIEKDLRGLVITRTPQDPFGLRAWESAAEDYVIKKADALHEEAQAKVKVASVAPAGTSEAGDSLSLIKRGMQQRRR